MSQVSMSDALHRKLSQMGLTPGELGLLSKLMPAYGVASVTGSGDIVTGLKSVVAVIACQQDDASINASMVTATIGDQSTAPVAGSIRVKVWAPTSSGNPTPVASTTPTNVNWVALGIPF